MCATPARPSSTRRLRETIIRIAHENTPAERRALGGGANMLLHKDPVFEEVILNPKLLTVAEVMCGKGAMISQIAASIRPKGAGAIGLHADQNWTPAPFPVHNQLVTFCWACDEFNEANGSTKVVPKSHLLRRHPTEKRRWRNPVRLPPIASQEAAWSGTVRPGTPTIRARRRASGSYCTSPTAAWRCGPVESYDFLDEEWLKGKPYELRVLLGREGLPQHPRRRVPTTA